jgi:hypothetical protein
MGGRGSQELTPVRPAWRPGRRQLLVITRRLRGKCRRSALTPGCQGKCGRLCRWACARRDATAGRKERCTAVLPAWSAASLHDLTHPSLGFGVAAATLAELMNLDPSWYQARQAAVARYSRTGFEAAAVTARAWAGGRSATRQGLLRTAELRFGHPFAVVAVTADHDHRPWPDAPRRNPWQGLPVFSAWITRPEDVNNRRSTHLRLLRMFRSGGLERPAPVLLSVSGWAGVACVGDE